MPNITTTTADKFIPELWSYETLRAAEAALVMAPLIKRYDELVSGRGDTIHIPNISNLTTNSKTQGSEVTTQAVTETETTISINQWEETSFEIEDIVKVQSQYDLRAEYTEKAGYAIAQKVDSDLLGLYSSLGSDDVGTYGTDVGDAELVAAIEKLDLVNAPLTDRFFIMHPSQKSAVMKLDKFVSAYHLGDVNSPSPIQTGPNNRYLWGEIYGIPFYYTTQVTSTAGTPTQRHNLLFHKEAFALAMQQAPRTQASYWQKDLAWIVTVDVLYGYSVLRDTFGVEIRS